MPATASPPSPQSPPSTDDSRYSAQRSRFAKLVTQVLVPGLLLVLAPIALGFVSVGAFRATRWSLENWWAVIIVIAFLLLFVMGGFMTIGSGSGVFAFLSVLTSITDAMGYAGRGRGGGGGGKSSKWVRWLLALVLGAGVLGVLGFIASRIDILDWIMRHNLLVSIVIVVAVLQSALHRSARQQLNWKKLVDPWLKFNGIGVIGVGGIGVLGATKTATILVDAVVASPYVNLRVLTSVYLVALALYGVATLIAHVGRTLAEKEEEYKPIRWFIPAFALAWLGSVLVFAIFFDSVLLSFHANLTFTPSD